MGFDIAVTQALSEDFEDNLTNEIKRKRAGKKTHEQNKEWVDKFKK